MQKRNTLRLIGVVSAGVLFILSLAVNLGLFFARPALPASEANAASLELPDSVKKGHDAELAYLLTKLVLQTRSEMAGHYTRKQSALPGVDKLYQRLLVRNLILPAAVADSVFAKTVPSATGGRAWVKMVVDSPRNPNNRGDEVALALLAELREGAVVTERDTGAAFYYAEPIKAKSVCLYCHGGPKGDPDPFFPQYTKDGWREGDIIGAVVARVARKTAAD